MDGLPRGKPCRLSLPFPLFSGHIIQLRLDSLSSSYTHGNIHGSLLSATTNMYRNQDIRHVRPEPQSVSSHIRLIEKGRDRSTAQYLLPHWLRKGYVWLNGWCDSNQHRVHCRYLRRRLARRRYKAFFVGMTNVQTELKSCKSSLI